VPRAKNIDLGKVEVANASSNKELLVGASTIPFGRALVEVQLPQQAHVLMNLP
jgi:hypothetical protein